MNRAIVSLFSLLVLALPCVAADNALRDGDFFEMKLSGPPEELTREFNVTLTVDQGAVTVPLIGRVPVKGLTSSELASEIEGRLKRAKIFSAANVSITGTPQRFFFIGGSVRVPGKQSWTSDFTLTAAINAAGGPGEFASDKIKLVRNGKVQTFSRKAISKNPSLDPKIQPGDNIELDGQ